jgi:hypothetical protein
MAPKSRIDTPRALFLFDFLLLGLLNSIIGIIFRNNVPMHSKNSPMWKAYEQVYGEADIDS